MPVTSRGTVLLAAASIAFGVSTAFVGAAHAQPAPYAQPVVSQPAVGDPCIGAEIGRRTTDADGRAIICDNYRWTVDVGQRARHPWVDDQRSF